MEGHPWTFDSGTILDTAHFIASAGQTAARRGLAGEVSDAERLLHQRRLQGGRLLRKLVRRARRLPVSSVLPRWIVGESVLLQADGLQH